VTREEAVAAIPGAGKAPESIMEARKIATSVVAGEEDLLDIVRTGSKRVGYLASG
jgi:hypothetical protein